MSTNGTIRVWLPILSAVLLALSHSPASSDTNVFIVRHAERAESSDDPGLTPDGSERARLLRDMLRSVPLGGIYSTDTRRTRDTVLPVAEGRTVEIAIYDHKDMAGFVEILKTRHRDQNVLVSGHTNTIPALIKALGLDREIDVTDAEYDNLFLVTLPDKGSPRLLHLHYGY